VDGETVTALADRTGGNPFYVSESARLLASEGALVATSEVPDGVRDVLRRRLARLPEPAVAVLRLAAVVGRESDVDLLVRACDKDEGVVLDALDAGLIAGLLTEPGPGRVRFVHALVRDTLYTDQSQVRRARAHARVARELEGLNPADLAGLAHHYAEAASPATARLAVDYAVRAAQAAELRYATVACAALLRQALASIALAPDARPASWRSRSPRAAAARTFCWRPMPGGPSRRCGTCVPMGRSTSGSSATSPSCCDAMISPSLSDVDCLRPWSRSSTAWTTPGWSAWSTKPRSSPRNPATRG